MMKNRYFLTQFPKFSPFGKQNFEADLFDPFSGLSEQKNTLNPLTDIKETDQCYLLSVDLPGMDEKNIQIQVEDGHVLSVSGYRDEEKKKEDKTFIHLEKSYGEFYRSFQLSSHIDQENIQARYTNGVLEVLVPKKGTRSKIKIETNGEKTKGVFKKFLGH